MEKSWILMAIFVFSLDLIESSPGSTGIFFQEHDLILPQGTHNTKRKPISKPDICKDDELLYPGDLDDDWVCDCRPTYVYHPDHDKCYALYRQGPCARGEHLLLKDGSKVPQCERNTCQRDNEVKFQGRCYALGQPGPCTNILTADVVEVNETTLELGCVKTRRYPTVLNTRFTEISEIHGCKKGSKREQRICEEKSVQYWIAPELCGDDKALYKIANETESLCDCKPGYIYHPDTKLCYQAHLRGPCDSGKIFVLKDDAGACVAGGCKGRKKVSFDGKCVEIGKTASCTDNAVVGVNPETYEIGCVTPLENSKPGTVISGVANCPKGNKRDINNQC